MIRNPLNLNYNHYFNENLIVSKFYTFNKSLIVFLSLEYQLLKFSTLVINYISDEKNMSLNEMIIITIIGIIERT